MRIISAVLLIFLSCVNFYAQDKKNAESNCGDGNNYGFISEAIVKEISIRNTVYVKVENQNGSEIYEVILAGIDMSSASPLLLKILTNNLINRKVTVTGNETKEDSKIIVGIINPFAPNKLGEVNRYILKNGLAKFAEPKENLVPRYNICEYPAIEEKAKEAKIGIWAKREKSTLLPASEAKNVTKQCSRPSPENFSGTWEPSEEEIREMEANFWKIKKLKVEECCIVGEQIENPDKFYMQYAGIIVDGKRLIYINAFSESGILRFVQNSDGTFSQVSSDDWKKSAVIICDGGNEWGVLYDPKTKKFFDLAVNGI